LLHSHDAAPAYGPTLK